MLETGAAAVAARPVNRAFRTGGACAARWERRMNKTIGLLSVAVLTGLGAMQTAAGADPAPADAASLGEALTGGKLLLNLRPRYEHVEQDGKPNNADAYTMRTLLGYRTGTWKGLSATFEGINVGHLGTMDYNPIPTVTTSPFPTVADPDFTGVNQLYVDYTALPQTTVRAGQQSIKVDNVRFIGNVEFRQVMQTFNAVTVENTSLSNTRLYAGYLIRQHTINGTQRDVNEPIFNVRYTWKPGNNLIGYGYLQDQANTGQNATTGLADGSNKIFGARADGGYPFGTDWKLLYTAEYAKQDNYSGGDAIIDAYYYHLNIGGQWKDTFVRVHQELLSSNDGKYGFQTPLGTNHLFQGWVDKFLITPKNGIRDSYVSAGTKVQKLGIYMEYHRYRTAFQSLDMGDEFDIGLTYPLLKQLIGKIEYGDYRGGDPAAGGNVNTRDTRRFWLTLIYNY
jgi:hypothetical protein